MCKCNDWRSANTYSNLPPAIDPGRCSTIALAQQPRIVHHLVATRGVWRGMASRQAALLLRSGARAATSPAIGGTSSILVLGAAPQHNAWLLGTVADGGVAPKRDGADGQPGTAPGPSQPSCNSATAPAERFQQHPHGSDDPRWAQHGDAAASTWGGPGPAFGVAGMLCRSAGVGGVGVGSGSSSSSTSSATPTAAGQGAPHASGGAGPLDPASLLRDDDVQGRMTPSVVVDRLNQYIVGQLDAKKVRRRTRCAAHAFWRGLP